MIIHKMTRTSSMFMQAIFSPPPWHRFTPPVWTFSTNRMHEQSSHWARPAPIPVRYVLLAQICKHVILKGSTCATSESEILLIPQFLLPKYHPHHNVSWPGYGLAGLLSGCLCCTIADVQTVKLARVPLFAR